jgi:hypothetical protein
MNFVSQMYSFQGKFAGVVNVFNRFLWYLFLNRLKLTFLEKSGGFSVEIFVDIFWIFLVNANRDNKVRRCKSFASALDLVLSYEKCTFC